MGSIKIDRTSTELECLLALDEEAYANLEAV